MENVDMGKDEAQRGMAATKTGITTETQRHGERPESCDSPCRLIPSLRLFPVLFCKRGILGVECGIGRVEKGESPGATAGLGAKQSAIPRNNVQRGE